MTNEDRKRLELIGGRVFQLLEEARWHVALLESITKSIRDRGGVTTDETQARVLQHIHASLFDAAVLLITCATDNSKRDDTIRSLEAALRTSITEKGVADEIISEASKLSNDRLIARVTEYRNRSVAHADSVRFDESWQVSVKHSHADLLAITESLENRLNHLTGSSIGLLFVGSELSSRLREKAPEVFGRLWNVNGAS